MSPVQTGSKLISTTPLLGTSHVGVSGLLYVLDVACIDKVLDDCHPYFAQVQSMDDNCGEWVECMGVACACGEQEVGVASGVG